ncbi:glycosyltransferase [Paenibacillus sp. M-152]|uniref:glycosyltransferase n=1 Tax=Paenibacillus sp. M-152 TaxID=2487928 RepID=UPI000F6B7CCD|nr:glycosyltransferase [Paenibacillus sp. M-152]AZH27577.1 glycosyltransferase [Paenibacillus sp. M-152]
MAIRYSVIIPTYNRAQQLLLTLASFEAQTYSKQLFEVIVADDGSTDGTKEVVEGFKASYPLTYVSHPEQRGRSAVRNLGLRRAKGLYIIFCDADFLVLPHFIKTVSRYHRKYPKSVLSGIPHSWDDAFTHYHPDFSVEEKEHCRSILTQSGLWNPDFETANEIIPIITPDDVLHQTGALSKVVSPTRVPPSTQKQFASTDVAPWMMLVTRCVAIRRNHLIRIGGFNERFVLYGLEDWDLGYRLHRLKIPFYCIKELVGYHQEHPTHLRGNVLNTENLRIMYETYGFNDSSLNLFALIPPSEDFETYKNTLRVLRRGLRSRLTRSSAMLLRRTLRIAAKQFYYHNNTPAYQQSLRAIKKKAENRKSRVAHVLREMLVKSEKLLE